MYGTSTGTSIFNRSICTFTQLRIRRRRRNEIHQILPKIMMKNNSDFDVIPSFADNSKFQASTTVVVFLLYFLFHIWNNCTIIVPYRLEVNEEKNLQK